MDIEFFFDVAAKRDGFDGSIAVTVGCIVFEADVIGVEVVDEIWSKIEGCVAQDEEVPVENDDFWLCFLEVCLELIDHTVFGHGWNEDMKFGGDAALGIE